MKALLMTFALVTGMATAHAETVGDKIRHKIATQDIKINFDVFNLNLGDHVGIDVESGIRVFPNEDDKTYSRSEPLSFRFSLGAQFNPGLLSVGGSRTMTLTGEFIRQFNSQWDALNVVKFRPYMLDPKKVVTGEMIPITAERARRFKDKDYFRYQLRGAISANVGVGKDIGLVDLRAGYSRVFYGDFQIEVYKRGNNKVYVRASSLKQTSRSIGFSLDQSFIFDAFDIPVIDNLADKIIPQSIVKVDLSKMEKGQIFAVEYLFDLNNPEASRAYDQFMNYRNWRVLDLAKVVDPITGSGQMVRETLAMHLNETESLSLADANRPENQARVRRVVKSQTQFSNQSSGGIINFSLIRLGQRTSYVEQNIKLTVDPRSDYNQFYRIATTNFDESFGGILALGTAEKRRGEANILFELNPNMTIRDFMELNFSYEETDNNFRKGSVFREDDLAQIGGRIYKMLPGYLHGPERDKKDNPVGPGVRGFVLDQLPKYQGDEVFVDLDVIVSKQALGLTAALSQTEVVGIIRNFIEEVFQDQSINGITKRDYGDLDLEMSSNDPYQKCNGGMSKQSKYECISNANAESFDKILERVPLILGYAKAHNYEQQWRQLVYLQQDPLFRAIGTGIFTRLIFAATEKSGKHFEDYVYYKMSIKNTEGQQSIYEKGLPERPQVFSELIKIRNRILNRRFDPSYFDLN